jgi:hypothetical protein
MTTPTDMLIAARAEALFTSDLPTGSRPTRAAATAAIRGAVRAHGGVRGCATALAGAYGEHPETAAPRMRWALAAIQTAYSRPVEKTHRLRRSVRGFHWSAQPAPACPSD